MGGHLAGEPILCEQKAERQQWLARLVGVVTVTACSDPLR
jgi:hypothetical protein